MSCNSNSPIARPSTLGSTRRSVCAALAAWPLAGRAQTAAPPAPATPPVILKSLQRWGSGAFRRFGLLVYEATLWAAARDALQPQPPLALQLTYRRALTGDAIAQASMDQMRRFEPTPAQLAQWSEQLAGFFPDVSPGDRLLGHHVGDQVHFFHNDRPLGTIEGRDFAQTFFAIWLDPRTSAPALRAALLQRPPG